MFWYIFHSSSLGWMRCGLITSKGRVVKDQGLTFFPHWDTRISGHGPFTLNASHATLLSLLLLWDLNIRLHSPSTTSFTMKIAITVYYKLMAWKLQCMIYLNESQKLIVRVRYRLQKPKEENNYMLGEWWESWAFKDIYIWVEEINQHFCHRKLF